MARSFFPGTDALLLAWSNNFRTLTSANPATYGLSVGQATQYATLDTLWAASYQAAIDPITRTKGKVAAKDQARHDLKVNARLLAKVVEGQASVTNEMKVNLGLNVRAMPVPIPPPTLAPGLDIVSVTGRSAKIRLHDAASTTKRGRPPGVAGASVFSFVGSSAPTDLTAWKFEGNTTRTVLDVAFSSTVAAGSTVWVTAFWYNPRAQRGPTCNPISTSIAGGMGMAA